MRPNSRPRTLKYLGGPLDGKTEQDAGDISYSRYRIDSPARPLSALCFTMRDLPPDTQALKFSISAYRCEELTLQAFLRGEIDFILYTITGAQQQ